MFSWLSRRRTTQRESLGHLNNVIAGTGFSQHVVGFVDDFSRVYDLDKHAVGSVDVIANTGEHVVRSAIGGVVGYVGSKSEPVNGGHWHKVYDRFHVLVGLVDNASEIDTPDDQTIGGVNYNEGNNGTGWLRAGAALLLLVRQLT